MKKGFTAIAGICGVLFPIFLFGTSLLAVSFSPSFSWSQNWLSDLGGQIHPTVPWRFTILGVVDMPVYERPLASTATTASIFNTGVAITGIILLIFALGLRKSLLTTSGRMSTLLLIIGAIAWIFVGIFPESMAIFHLVPAILVFLLVPTSMCCIGVLMAESDRKLGYITFILGLIGYFGITVFMTLLELQTFTYWRATPEVINFLAVSVFTIIFGVKMFRQAPKPILARKR